MLVDEKAVCRRFAFEERNRSFDSPNAADERPGQRVMMPRCVMRKAT